MNTANTPATKEEMVTVLNLVRQLNFEQLKSFYYMTKGAKLVADAEKTNS